MAHQVETMAFRHETPWHRLGVRVTEDMTPDEFKIAAGCDWRVVKRPVFVGTYSADNGAPILDTHTLVDRKVAICRETDGKVFDIVGPNFKPVQNDKIFATFKKFCEAGGATMETAGALKGGSVIWGLANLGNGFVLPGGDAVKGYMLVATRHEAGFATIGRLTPIRVVCANTFAASGGFEGDSSFRVPHTEDFDPDWAADQMNICRDGMTEFEKNAKVLQKLNLSKAEAFNLLLPIYQPREEPEVVADIMGRGMDSEKLSRTIAGILDSAANGPGSDQVKAKGKADFTGWGLFNGATYYFNHKARGGDSGNRFASTLLGTNATNLTRTYRQLLKLAA